MGRTLRRRHLPCFTTTLLLISVLSVAGCDFDVTGDPVFQHGWTPGHQYELRRTMALVLNKQTGEVYFDPYRADKQVGDVVGNFGDYEQILVENAPRGTRFRVEKMIRLWNPISMSVTVPVGRMLSGSCQGKVVQLYSVSEHDQIGEHELVDRRDDEIVSPVPDR